jgi:hypothetical protein
VSWCTPVPSRLSRLDSRLFDSSPQKRPPERVFAFNAPPSLLRVPCHHRDLIIGLRLSTQQSARAARPKVHFRGAFVRGPPRLCPGPPIHPPARAALGKPPRGPLPLPSPSCISPALHRATLGGRWRRARLTARRTAAASPAEAKRAARRRPRHGRRLRRAAPRAPRDVEATRGARSPSS